MPLTIPELARAVGKSENYVRQHVFRRHLAVQKDGRNVSVTHDEALRWARERQLPFEPPAKAWEQTGTAQIRTARMTVLTLHRPETKPCNLLTVVRHRRQDALGPWSIQPSNSWTSEDLGNGLRLFTLDAPLEHCRALVDGILDSATLVIDDDQIHYAVEPTPRHRRAFRDERGLADASMTSPFSRFSAEVVEYWSRSAEPRRHWLDLLDSRRGRTPLPLSRLGVPLDRLSDRVGNIIIAGAEDEVACDLAVGNGRTLRLHVDAEPLLPGAYRATIWASHAGDEVLRQEVTIKQRLTTIELSSDVDFIGFAIFRTADGQCLDFMEAPLWLRISGRLRVNSASTLQFRDRQGRVYHEVNPPGPSSEIDVGLDDERGELDKEIRRRWLDRRVREREVAARRERNLARFLPPDLDDAVSYLLDLLRHDADQKTPIYLADAHFETQLPSDARKQVNLRKIYLDIFGATAGTPLRILCAKKKPAQDEPPPWWSACAEQITAHVRVRSFRSQDGRTDGFHDRFLITPRREIMISHSFNGWHNHGVTFVSLPYGVYRAEAERSWSMDVGSPTTDLLVWEIGQ